MNEESNSVDKYVISSEEVQALRMLNQLMKQKSLTKRELFINFNTNIIYF